VFEKAVQQRLSNKRYIHSKNVCDTAVLLAKKFGADPKSAAVAGILHDITKECSLNEHIQLCQKYKIELDDIEKNEIKLLHAITGAYYVKDIFSIEDNDIFNAIRYHTTGRAQMSVLEKIIYLADYIEPGRDFLGVDELRQRAFENIDDAMKLAFEMSIKEILEKNRQIHKNTLMGRNFLAT
jgi:nicotinate-nucleotide adenylyltransferase